MSKFFCTPPDYVTVNGERYPINTDFRVWLEICDMLSKQISLKEKLCFLLINSYCSKLPPDMGAAVNAVIAFMNMNEKKHSKRNTEQIVDFFEDRNMIYAAFRQQYGINLFCDDLHWWEFVALLSALDENTVFMKIVGYRSVDVSKIKDEKRRNFYRKMKNRYKINREVDDSDIVKALMK